MAVMSATSTDTRRDVLRIFDGTWEENGYDMVCARKKESEKTAIIKQTRKAANRMGKNDKKETKSRRGAVAIRAVGKGLEKRQEMRQVSK